MRNKKRVQKNHLSTILVKNHNQVVERFRREWDGIQRDSAKEARKEKIKRYTREIGMRTGQALLILLLISGVVMIAAVAPNIFVAFGRRGKRRSFFHGDSLERTLMNLRKRKFITIEKQGQKTAVSLTWRGEPHALVCGYRQFGSLRAPQEEKGYIWMVVFDIPNSSQWAREHFRRKLRSLGFRAMQKSVYVSACPREADVRFLAELFGITQYVKVMKVAAIWPGKDFVH